MGYSDSVIKCHAPLLHGLGITGKGVKVAIMDTGIKEHPDLFGRVVFKANYTDDDNGDMQDVTDYFGHGTHVAGIIAACGPDLVGMAPGSLLYVYKVVEKNGACNQLRLAQAIRDAVSQGVHIIHMSLSGPEHDSVHDAIKAAVAANILIVAAAGNDGDGNYTTDEKGYPGAYPEVVCVGSTYADYSKISFFSDSNDELDLVAPGELVNSCWIDGGYKQLNGTSMAAPHVTGAAALLQEQFMQIRKRYMTELELFKAICENTMPLPITEVPKTAQGNGRLILKGIPPIPDIEEISDREAIYGLVEMGVFDSPAYWIGLCDKFLSDPVKYADFRFVSLGFIKCYHHMLELMYYG